MFKTIIKEFLKKNYHSFSLSYDDFDKVISDVEMTAIKLVNALDSCDQITDRSIVKDYQFIADTNVMKCLCSSAVVMSDKFANRINQKAYIIAKPDISPRALSKESEVPVLGDVMSAKDWNNFWRDVVNWTKDSKPLACIEKKPVLFNDLTGIFDGVELVSFEQGIIPLEQIAILEYTYLGASKLSPIKKDVDLDLNIEAWILEGLK